MQGNSGKHTRNASGPQRIPVCILNLGYLPLPDQISSVIVARGPARSRAHNLSTHGAAAISRAKCGLTCENRRRIRRSKFSHWKFPASGNRNRFLRPRRCRRACDRRAGRCFVTWRKIKFNLDPLADELYNSDVFYRFRFGKISINAADWCTSVISSVPAMVIGLIKQPAFRSVAAEWTLFFPSRQNNYHYWLVDSWVKLGLHFKRGSFTWAQWKSRITRNCRLIDRSEASMLYSSVRNIRGTRVCALLNVCVLYIADAYLHDL